MVTKIEAPKAQKGVSMKLLGQLELGDKAIQPFAYDRRPVDRAAAGHQCRGTAVRQQGMLINRHVAHRSLTVPLPAWLMATVATGGEGRPRSSLTAASAASTCRRTS